MPKKSSKDRRIQRAQDYRDRQEQRSLDRDMTREVREVAEIEGRDLLAEKRAQIRAYFAERLHTAGDMRFIDALASTPVPFVEAQRRIDRYFSDGPGRRVQASPPLSAGLDAEKIDWLKKGILGLDVVPPALRAEFDRRYDVTRDSSYLISGLALALSAEGSVGPYDDTFPGGEIFWRGDDRPPSRVHSTGFSAKVTRDLGRQSNVIIYRTGADDIVPASGVCIAKDIRGGAFFPFSRGPAYLYAVVMDSAANTFRAQRKADRVESGRADWRIPERFVYDPNEEDADEASTVWEYREHVTHRIEAAQIVGAWELRRELLVSEGKGEEIKAGMRFALVGTNVWPRSWSSPRAVTRREKAELVASAYKMTYPREPGHYLSYQGIVRKIKAGSPRSMSDARDWVAQVDAIPSPPAGAGAKALAKYDRLERNRLRRAAQWPAKQAKLGPSYRR